MIPSSPSGVLVRTIVACPLHTVASGETISTWKVLATVSRRSRRQDAESCRRTLGQLGGLGLGVLASPHHVEGLLGVLVHVTVEDSLEGGDGLLQGGVHPRLTGELLGNEHRLGKEALNPPRPSHHESVLLG